MLPGWWLVADGWRLVASAEGQISASYRKLANCWQKVVREATL